MDFLKNLASKTEDAPAEHKPNEQPKAPSTSELFSDAKVVADAAKSKFSNQEFDQAKAAGSAADLLNAASHYGKLEEDKGLGKIVNQAEDYLHKYSTTSTTTTTTTATDGSGHSTTHTESQKTTHEAAESGGGGYGDYMKMAGDFLKKN